MLSIRPLTTDHKPQWQQLWQGYLNFYQTELPSATTDNTWQKIVDENSPIFGFGAFESEKLIGFVHVVLHPNTWNTTECCYLEDLFVSEHGRGKGVGRALIEHIYQFAKAKNCNRVYWVTQATNHTARQLYDNIANETDFVQYRYLL